MLWYQYYILVKPWQLCVKTLKMYFFFFFYYCRIVSHLKILNNLSSEYTYSVRRKIHKGKLLKIISKWKLKNVKIISSTIVRRCHGNGCFLTNEFFIFYFIICQGPLQDKTVFSLRCISFWQWQIICLCVTFLPAHQLWQSITTSSISQFLPSCWRPITVFWSAKAVFV